VRRRWSDLFLLTAGFLVLVVSMAAASETLSELEVRVFRSVNELPDAIRPAVWPFMQYGTFITIPLLTMIALAFRRWRLAFALAIAGLTVYLLARVVQDWVERGRPGALLTGVNMREVFGEGSLGFPSGHAAVAAALTVVASVYLGRRWIPVVIALAAIVVFGRMYVGAHLPLDLVGIGLA
jgi:undecaprenyl-diphosphatase